MISSLIQSLKQSKAAGLLEYYAFPCKQNSWGGGGPFNGQEFRKKIFHELVAQCSFSRIVETGAFRGVTTEFMHQTSRLPVESVEYSGRFYAFTKARIGRNPNIRLQQGDSRGYLRRHFATEQHRRECTFVYLDAHWQDDLPLREELEIISQSEVPAVVMIDDFEVPDDEDYTFDDYGPGKALNSAYLETTVFSAKPWFYPALSGREETGARRGVVVIPTTEHLTAVLRGAGTLRERTRRVG